MKNSPIFPSFENVLISPSFLNGISTWHRILWWQFFFSHLKIFCYFLLASVVSDKNLPFELFCPCKVLPHSCWFQCLVFCFLSLVFPRLCVSSFFPCVHLVWYLPSFLNLEVHAFVKFWKLSIIISSNT